MEKIIWTDRMNNEAVLHRVKEERSILHTIRQRPTGLAIYCVGTAFEVTTLKERLQGQEGEEGDVRSCWMT
jgi:hypothetical protein